MIVHHTFNTSLDVHVNCPQFTRHFEALQFGVNGGVMSAKRYTEEFKVEAVKQVTQRGRPVAEVAGRLGVTPHSMYQWIKRYTVPEAERQAASSQADEVKRLKAELKRVTEERDILKKAAAYFARTSE